jgi:hypothetical protein
MSKARNAAPKNLRARLVAYRSHLASTFKPGFVFMTDLGKRTAAQLIADLDAALQPFKDVDLQRDVLDGLLRARKTAQPSIEKAGNRALWAIRTAHSSDDPVLKLKFLRTPGGRHKQTAGQSVVATAKRLRSRKLTGVMGKKQRAAKLRGE